MAYMALTELCAVDLACAQNRPSVRSLRSSKQLYSLFLATKRFPSLPR